MRLDFEEWGLFARIVNEAMRKHDIARDHEWNALHLIVVDGTMKVLEQGLQGHTVHVAVGRDCSVATWGTGEQAATNLR
ncbi:MAG: hypothetical protein ACKPKO_11285, partial [Candidatus Fonsibacter sp.]